MASRHSGTRRGEVLILWFLLLFVSTGSAAGNELQLNSEVRIGAEATYLPEDQALRSLTPDAVLDLHLAADTPQAALASIISLSRDAVRLRYLLLDWYISDSLQLAAGRFTPGIGETVAFPAFSLFAPSDVPLLNRDSAPPHPWAVQLSRYSPNSYVQLSASPEPPFFSLPAAGSEWLPTEDIPEEISLLWPGLGRKTWRLAGVATAVDPPDPSLDSLSLAAEAGWYFSQFDVSVLAFHGMNARLIPTYAIPLQLDTNKDPIDYIATISPAYFRHSLLMLRGSGSFGQLWWWLELAGTPNSYAAHEAAASQTGIVPVSVLAGTAGLGWFLPGNWGTLLYEQAHRRYWPRNDQPYTTPPLRNTAIAILELTGFSDAVTLQLGGMLDIPQLSWRERSYGSLLFAGIEWQAAQQLSLRLQAATLDGSSGLLAGYSGLMPLELELRVRF